MRCLSLADELKRWNMDVRFLCRAEAGNFSHVIERRGFQVTTLPAGLSQERELESVHKMLSHEGRPADWILIDHYGLDKYYESEIRKAAKQVMVIDDLADRPHDCDVLLDQNHHPGQNRYRQLIPETCVSLLGTDYALLRPQFREARQAMARQYETVSRLLVFMGGADLHNDTGKVLRAWQMLKRSDIVTDVIIGGCNPHAPAIQALAAQIPQVRCHGHVDNMAALMVQADIGVGAAGSTTWERCCVGLPGIVMIQAENQRAIAEHLETAGVVMNLGWSAQVNEQAIKHSLEQLLQDVNRRKEMSARGQHLVDGRGAVRVAEFLTHFGDTV